MLSTSHWHLSFWTFCFIILLHAIVITQLRSYAAIRSNWSIICIVPLWLQELFLWLLCTDYSGLLRLSTYNSWFLNNCPLFLFSYFNSILLLALRFSSGRPCNIFDMLSTKCLCTWTIINFRIINHIPSFLTASKFFWICDHSYVPARASHSSTSRLSGQWSTERIVLLMQTIL